MGPYLIAIPYTTDSTQTGPYIGANQGVSNAFVEPANAPGGRIGAVVGQFLMVGDILQSQTQQIGTGNGTLTTFAGSLFNTPMLATGAVYDQAGTLSGSFSNGLIAGSGLAQTSGLPGQFYSLADELFDNAPIEEITGVNGPVKDIIFDPATTNEIPGSGYSRSRIVNS